MSTPLSSRPLQMNRRQPQKRQCPDVTPTQSSPTDLSSLAESILSDESIPTHLRTIISCLLEDRKQLHVMLEHCRELAQSIDGLKAEIASLRNISQPVSSPNLDSSPVFVSDNPSAQTRHPVPPSTPSYEEIERRRSIVISGLIESQARVASERVLHDYYAAREIMDHLSIDCPIVAVYRLGRPKSNAPRLVKLVLPSSFFASQMIRRAPHMRYFKVPRLYLRPSLTKQERERRRDERARDARREVEQNSHVPSTDAVASSSSTQSNQNSSIPPAQLNM